MDLGGKSVGSHGDEIPLCNVDAHAGIFRLYSCTVVVTSSTTFTVSFSDTSGWHLGSAYWDIRFSDGIIFFSETAVLNIVNNVTVA